MENYPIINGIYDHYKGGVYQVITLSIHTETGDKTVVYKSLIFGTVYARPLSVWNDIVSVDGTHMDRFSLVKEK